jgi:hypothetical protein
MGLWWLSDEEIGIKLQMCCEDEDRCVDCGFACGLLDGLVIHGLNEVRQSRDGFVVMVL